MNTSFTRGTLLAGLLAVGACDRAPSSTQPADISPSAAQATLSRAATEAVDADRQLIRTVAMAAARDGIDNADQWFGDRAHRNRASVCRGIERILARHMATYDEAKHRSRSAADRLAESSEIVRAVGCGKPAAMTLFGRPVALSPAAALALPDSVDDWLAANWHPDFWSQRVSQWADRGVMFIEPYDEGMTEFELANFQGVQCAGLDVVSDLSMSEGDGFMAMYFWPSWTRAALIGCGTNVVVNIPDLVTGGRLGFALAGPWGAAGAAAAVAAEHCIYGAIAGYLAYKAG
jgi:hypothetical protein